MLDFRCTRPKRLRRGGRTGWGVLAAAALSAALGCREIPREPLEAVRSADLRARFPTPVQTRDLSGKSSAPLLYSGEGGSAIEGAGYAAGPGVPAEVGAHARDDGVEINFDGAEIATVAKVLLGDVLGLNYAVDPRVQGTITMASARPIRRRDVVPAFESVLRLSGAGLVREGGLVTIVPLGDAVGSGPVRIGADEPGFGVSIVPLRNVSAATIARAAEGFVTRPGAIRVDAARNLVLVSGTGPERRGAVEAIAGFDVEWLRNQSVGVFPLKSTSPETMIQELERIFETAEGGQGQGVIRFQPIQRMNAVMAVTKNMQFLERAADWVQRLDRADRSGTTLRVYKLQFGEAKRVAAVLNDIFGSRNGATADTALDQLAPGLNAGRSRLDSLGRGSMDKAATSVTATARPGGADQTAVSITATGVSGAAPAGAGDPGRSGDATAPFATPGNARGPFANIRITADIPNNSIVIYSNQEDYRLVERALREIDRAPLQVSIEATIAEVTLTDGLRYGVQSLLTSPNIGLDRRGGAVNPTAAIDQSAVGGPAPASVVGVATSVASNLVQRVLPGSGILLSSRTRAQFVLEALSSLTDVKVLSSPSLVVVDNQPAVLQVGDEVPVSTRSATLIENPNAPVVNNIEFRNTGVILKVLPRVSANGVVQLELEQEISNVVGDQQTLTPTIAQRRVRSTISVTSGQTVLLAGLISERLENARAGLPGLRQIKFLGDLFGGTVANGRRTELIVFIKPQVIRNSVDAQGVAEEFRDRLDSMRPRFQVNGRRAVPIAPAPAPDPRTLSVMN